MNKFRRFLSMGMLAVATLLLSSCKLEVLNPKGVIAASEKALLIDATLLMLIVVIPVILLTLWFAWHYRASNKTATYKPNDHHNTHIEIVCWSIPIVIIAILATMTWISTHKLDPYRPLASKSKPIVIQAVSLNWKWLFIYPEENIATVNYVQFPVNKQVKFLVTSDAPMNSFQIPQLAGQIYSMGGMQTKLHLKATHIGLYTGRSTNYSGAGFSGMHFQAKVSSRQDYQRWLQKVRDESQSRLTITRYNQLMKDSRNNPPQYFSGVVDKLFHKIIMKFMMPMPEMETISDGTKRKGVAK